MEPQQLTELKETLTHHLRGGFAPLMDLLNEFDYHKTGEVLDGLHFSAYSLLLHMHHRQRVLLEFIRNPQIKRDLWPQAHWPEKYRPDSEEEWQRAKNDFKADMEEMTDIVSSATSADLLQPRAGGETIYRAAVVSLHHNAYHIGQLKTIGRQLGVW